MSDTTQGKTIEERIDATIAPEEPQKAVEEKQPEQMPSSEQKPIEEVKQPEEVQPDGDLTLPEDASERTKTQFEKLKARLAEEKAKNKPQEIPQDFGTSVFDSFKPPVPEGNQPQIQPSGYLDQQQVTDIRNQFIDQDGNVDINGLNQALANANNQAQRATEQARIANERIVRFEETQQVKEAHIKYPELDPLNKEKFNTEFFEAVRDRVLRRNYVEGKNMSLIDIADEVSKGLPKPAIDEVKVKEQGAAEYKAAQEARNQGPLSQGKGEPRQTETYQELRERTRKGGFWNNPALDERLEAVTKPSK